MTLLDNIMLAFKNQQGENIIRGILNSVNVKEQERKNLKKSLEILETLKLYHLRNESAAILSGGQRKMLELGQALATEPEMLLLDEPTAGATAAETAMVVSFIRRMKEEQGLTLLIVEHKMDVIMGICDKIFVISYGEKIMEGSAEEVRRNEKVREAYLGRED